MTLAILGLWYFLNYVTIKADSGKTLFYNPFMIDEEGFSDNYEKATDLLTNGDTSSARIHFTRAIEYRGSYNERVRSNIYSDGNGYWEYKQAKLLKFSYCFEHLGMLDSAMNCLEPALYNLEKHHYPTEEQFFRLAITKYGKEEVIEELKAGISNIQKIDCFMCTDYFFKIKGVKLGLDESEYLKNNEVLFEDLKEKYCG